MGFFDFLGNIGSTIQANRMGKKQMEMGRNMIEEAQALASQYERPEFQTPEAFQAMVNMSQARQFQNMPGYTTMQNQLDKATAGAMSNINRMGSGAEGIGAISNLYANQMGQQADLATQNAMFRDQAQQQYMGALEGLGDWQQRGWEWNQADPYMQAMQKAAMLETMGRQGEWEGLKTKMGSWAEGFQGIGSALDETASSIGSAKNMPMLTMLGG